MTKSEPLSLETVSWPVRIIAMGPACLVVMAALLAATIFDGWLQGVPVETIYNSGWGALLAVLFIVLALMPFAGKVFLYWGLPALVGHHFCLKYRLNFLGFAAAGMAAGILGMAMSGGVFRDGETTGSMAGVLAIGFVCGGAGSVTAWCSMWLFRKRRRHEAIVRNLNAG